MWVLSVWVWDCSSVVGPGTQLRSIKSLNLAQIKLLSGYGWWLRIKEFMECGLVLRVVVVTDIDQDDEVSIDCLPLEDKK